MPLPNSTFIKQYVDGASQALAQKFGVLPSDLPAPDDQIRSRIKAKLDKGASLREIELCYEAHLKRLVARRT